MLDGEFAGERPCDFLLTDSLDGNHECWRVCKGRSPIPFLPPLAFQSPPCTGVQGRMLDKWGRWVLPKRVSRQVCLKRWIEWERGRPAKVSGYVVCTTVLILFYA